MLTSQWWDSDHATHLTFKLHLIGEQYLLVNNIIDGFWICIFYQSLSERIEQSEEQVWIKGNNTSRTIHWLSLNFYIRRKTSFGSGSRIPSYIQPKDEQYWVSCPIFWFLLLSRRFGPPPPSLGFWFPFKVKSFSYPSCNNGVGIRL